MKVTLKRDPKKSYVVYGVYWAIFNEKIQRHHFVIEHSDKLAGFSVLCEEEVDISDSSLSHYVMSKDDYDKDMFIHKAALSPQQLFLELVNHDNFESVTTLFNNMNELNLEI